MSIPRTIRASSKALVSRFPCGHRIGCAAAQSEGPLEELAATLVNGSTAGERCMAVAAAKKTKDTSAEIIRRFMGGVSRPVRS
jgi:hypothetical protein